MVSSLSGFFSGFCGFPPFVKSICELGVCSVLFGSDSTCGTKPMEVARAVRKSIASLSISY